MFVMVGGKKDGLGGRDYITLFNSLLPLHQFFVPFSCRDAKSLFCVFSGLISVLYTLVATTFIRVYPIN